MSQANQRHILDVDPAELTAWCQQRDLPGYRPMQIIEWVYHHRAESFEAMSNLPKALRADLAKDWTLHQARLANQAKASDGTIKMLLAWPDDATTECVLIPGGQRQTACISTQVGCPVGCAFCASGINGLERNLTAGQIVEQALRLATLATTRGGELTNVVLMGIGEPLLNYDAVIAAIRTINAPWGLTIGARRITLSTIGMPKQIRRLAAEDLQITLAISLHAPTDALRRELIPLAKHVHIEQILDAAAHYFRSTGREITFEYVLLDGVNDHVIQAERLAKLTHRLRCNVNLIRYNPVASLPYTPSTTEAVERFMGTLKRHGVNVHLRASRGTDIDAACGQLRLRHETQGTTVPEPEEPSS